MNQESRQDEDGAPEHQPSHPETQEDAREGEESDSRSGIQGAGTG
jgi:hypothetical protein